MKDKINNRLPDPVKNVENKEDLKRMLKWEHGLNNSLVRIADTMISPASTFKDIYSIVYIESKKITSSKFGFVNTVDADSGICTSLTISEMFGKECNTTGTDRKIEFPPTGCGHYPGLWGYCLNTKKAFYTNKPSKHISSKGIPKGHIPLDNFLSVPVMNKDKIIGQISLANSPCGYDNTQLTAIQNIASLYCIAIQRKSEEEKLEYLSFHDNLTGLYNRAFFEEELKRLDTERQLPLSFIIGDLNNLKLLNNTYGHREGDILLVRAAETIKKYCRSEDVVARWGGDEFVILLPLLGGEAAENIIERIQKYCENSLINTIPLSISFGVATKSKISQKFDEIIKEAEDNMYKNKLIQRKSASHSLLISIETMLAEKSFETKEHAERLKKWSCLLGKQLKLKRSELDELSMLSSMHDIGKVAIPETIILKPGKLNTREWNIIKRHPEIGYRIASSIPQTFHIAELILSCHERWDGKGYPHGLREDAIPLHSRIMLIVDAYDAMTSERPYRQPVSKQEAICELKKNAGTQFDPVLVDTFIKILETDK